ncbi:cAMP-binding protein [Arcticibacter svalbardensis MN12-7]|uniref:cAMP-binding protein n=1 Tax=Arcticibacter svalbardensis MN12-7 TaxID=1150600 RepID=R9GQX5_9SPHI|nr:cyclic nucleotide-binding domain-containing protein [Arcticibacter svalbardensis]EOR94222.1 cAMP-binding protein [Arcticibacter svalbardensis MN12-7]
MYTALLNHIKRYVPLQPEEGQFLCERLKPIKLNKKEFLLEPGKICQGNYFVVQGCLRQYFINKKLNEQILHFGIENWWIADQDSLLYQKPSSCYIQAIEESELLLLSESNRIILFNEVPKIESYFRMILQRALVASQHRVELMFTMTEEEIYRHFAARYPDFIQRVPQYMLASYLGFTPQFMSRLRAKKI